MTPLNLAEEDEASYCEREFSKARAIECAVLRKVADFIQNEIGDDGPGSWLQECIRKAAEENEDAL